MTIHEISTNLAPREVIERARSFFALTGTPSAAFVETEDEGFLRLHMEVGEIVIAALPGDGHTRVRGSASRSAHLLGRFLTTLAPPLNARQTVHRRGVRRAHGATVPPVMARAQAPAPAAPRAA